MSTPTTTNPLQATSDFIVLNASAGSGKTYSLVQHVLLNALRPADMVEAYQKVLAITFTNNAADEMKARLLKQLLEFTELSDPSSSAFFEPIWEALKIGPQELQKRAKGTARHMLHNYSTLQVGTIDQFTSRLVRTFTKDLQLTDNFEIRLDLEAMVAEALDLLYSTLGEHTELRDSLVELIQERMNRDKTHNPDRTLRKEGLKSFDESTWIELKDLPEPKRMLEIAKELDQELSKIVAEGRQWAEQCVTFMRTHGITLDQFTYKDQVEKHFLTFYHNLRRNDLAAGANAFKSRVKDGPAELWEDLRDQMKVWQDGNQRKLLMLKQATAKLQQLAATRSLLDQLDTLQESQNTMPLGAFNKLISEELQKEPSGFIYARLGERYWHFYIDEFQDTSTMQFHNLHPLIEHTLTKDERKNSALIVGDAKQSIYRWRGGRAEQFMSLVDGSSTLNKFGGQPEAADMYSRETVQLDRNFRTYPTIVNFNNAFFPEVAEQLQLDSHKRVYSAEGVGQTPQVGQANQGEVRVDFLLLPEGEKHSSEKHSDHVLEHTHQRIQELLAAGNTYSDIALLVRSNANAKKLANFLTQKNVPVLSADSLVVGASFESKLLIACAKIHLNSTDRESLFEAAFALTKLGRLPNGLEGFVFQKNTVDQGLSYLQNVFPGAKKIGFVQNSLYHFGTMVFETFGLLGTANAMVDAALDLLYLFQSMGGALSDLPSWWEVESKKRNVALAEDVSAVKITTIHKSKGLEYEHVLIPYGIDSNNRDSEYWIPFDLHPELKRMPITKTKATEHLFPAEQLQAIENEAHFDWMNMVYVAMTRPVRGLHIFVDGEKPDALGKALMTHLGVDGNAGNLSFGTPVPPEAKPVADPAMNQEESGPLNTRQSTLLLAQTAPKSWFNNEADARQWGTALHRILQHSPEQQNQALNRLYRSGKFTDELHQKASEILSELRENKELMCAQEPDAIVFIERTVAKEDRVLRPDLIVNSSNGTLVVDYKSGAERSGHQQQISNYVSALGNVFVNISESIIYL